MNYNKFKETIEKSLVLSEEYKANLLEDAKDFEPELLREILIVVYKNQMDFIEKVKELKKENNEEIREEEEQDKKEAEDEINKLFNF